MNVCQVLTEQSGAFKIIRFIKATTKPEEFEEFRKSKEFLEYCPHYQISDGGENACNNVFCQCAQEGNAILLEYLLEKYGKMFANIGNKFGHTPIYCATNCHDEDAGLDCVKVLLRFGGDPTITTAFSCGGSCKITHQGASPSDNCVALKREKIFQHLKLAHKTINF